MSQWVQHKSGQGEKLELLRGEHSLYEWIAKSPAECTNHYLLPKSEYILCEPPDEWDDVTDRCRVGDCVSISKDGRQSILFGRLDGCILIDVFHPFQSNEFRIRKIDLTYEACKYAHAFIVERRKA